MSLITGALLTVAELLNYLGLSQADITKPFFTLYNSSGDATSATVEKSGNTLTLIVVGGVNVSNTPIDLTLAANDTVAELVAVINALAKGWVANVTFGGDGRLTTDLLNIGATGCRLEANEIDVEGNDILYYENLINEATQQMENYCKRDGFITTGADETKYLNANFNRICFLKKYPVISITSVDLWDPNADPEVTAGSLSPGVDYVLREAAGVILRKSGWWYGLKKVKVVGQFGFTVANCPNDLKRACKELCAYNDAMADKVGLKSEKIGTYGYVKSDGSGENGGGSDSMPSEVAGKLAPYVNRGSNLG